MNCVEIFPQILERSWDFPGTRTRVTCRVPYRGHPKWYYRAHSQGTTVFLIRGQGNTAGAAGNRSEQLVIQASTAGSRRDTAGYLEVSSRKPSQPMGVMKLCVSMNSSNAREGPSQGMCVSAVVSSCLLFAQSPSRYADTPPDGAKQKRSREAAREQASNTWSAGTDIVKHSPTSIAEIAQQNKNNSRNIMYQGTQPQPTGHKNKHSPYIFSLAYGTNARAQQSKTPLIPTLRLAS